MFGDHCALFVLCLLTCDTSLFPPFFMTPSGSIPAGFRVNSSVKGFAIFVNAFCTKISDLLFIAKYRSDCVIREQSHQTGLARLSTLVVRFRQKTHAEQSMCVNL